MRIKRKVCKKCKESKYLYHFTRRMEAPDGRVGVCRICVMKARREIYRATPAAKDVTARFCSAAQMDSINFNIKG